MTSAVPLAEARLARTGPMRMAVPVLHGPMGLVGLVGPMAPRRPSAVALGLAALLCAALPTAWATEAAGQPPAHHVPGGGFRNTGPGEAPKGLLDVLAWQFEARRDGLPKPPLAPTPRMAPDLGLLHANARAGAAMQPAVTWIGHASVLAQLGGINILTDPVYAERASPLGFVGPKRQVPPGVALADLPHIDAVLISHNHYDHLDVASVRALNAQAGGPPLFLVPLGLKAWMADHGISSVVELDWWQSHTLRGVELALTPVQHWSGRGLTDRRATLWGGWAVFAPDQHLYFTGDTGYSADFAEIRRRFLPRQGPVGFDIALIAIGAYEPRSFMAAQHIDPAEAVRIHRDLAARQSLGIHWGTFELSNESLDEPPRALARARREQGVDDGAFVTVAVGETMRLPRREAAAVPPRSAP